MDKQYFAFISYKSEDVEWAVWLQHELEHYHLPASFNGRDDIRKDLRPIFRDIDELSAGNLPEQIHEALVNSQNLVVVCSPKAAKSPWVNQEVETFISLGRTNRIYPFIVEGNSPEEFFPPALLKLPKNQERLGGEVSKNGRDAAFVKIVAGMLHIDFDSLWNRYEKEKAEQERLEREKRDNLFRVQSRFIAEKARDLINEGDSCLAKKLLLEVLPQDVNNGDMPCTIEAEREFRKACKSYSAILNGHEDEVNSVAFSPDGKRIASASRDKSIRIWDMNTGREIRILNGHEDEVNSVAFSPDGKHIASASWDKSIRIWNVDTGELVIKIIGSLLSSIEHVIYSHEGEFIAAASGGVGGEHENIIKIYKADNWEEFKKMSGHKELVRAIAFSPDGKHIASASWDKSIRLWDVDTGQEIRILNGHKDGVNSVAFSPDGKHIASASRDKSIRLWDVDTGREIRILNGHEDEVNSVAFSPDGKRIASASRDKSIRIWDVDTGREIRILIGHKDEVNSVAFSPDGKRIASASGDLLSNYRENAVRLWDVDVDNNNLLTIRSYYSFDNAIFTSDGKSIISTSNDSWIQIWDAETGDECVKLRNDDSPIMVASFNSNKNHIFSASFNNVCRIWDPQNWEILRSILIENEEPLWCAAISPNERFIAVASINEYTIKVIDVITGDILHALKGHNSNIASIAFSPDSRYIISTSADGFSIVWNTTTGIEMKRIQGYETIYNLDGSHIFSLSPDKKIRMWDTRKWSVIKDLQENKNLKKIAVSPDEKFLVATSNDNTLQVYDVEKGDVILILKGHNGGVNSAVFDSQGKRIVSSSDDGTIRIWEFPALQDLIDQTREQFKDCPLTEEDRKKYYLD